MSQNIPLSQPDITQKEIDAVVDVLHTSTLSIGPRIEEFEHLCAKVAGRINEVGYCSIRTTRLLWHWVTKTYPQKKILVWRKIWQSKNSMCNILVAMIITIKIIPNHKLSISHQLVRFILHVTAI